MKDVVVVGAGICGSCIAYFLNKKGVDVTLIDKSSTPPVGGSMAAGAFISPKIGKKSPLLELTNLAFDFSWKFYKRNFPQYFHQDGILRIPRDKSDCQKFEIYEEFNYPNYQKWEEKEFKKFNLNLDCPLGFFFPDGGDCDAIKISQALRNNIKFIQFELESLEFNKTNWILKGANKTLEAKRVILAMGYESNNLNIDLDYMGIRPLWGSRGDFLIKEGGFDFSLHKDFSISSLRDGYVKIGATHLRAKEPCKICDGFPLKELEKKAKELTNLEIKLKKLYCGYRSGSKDFMPLLGKVVNVKKTLEKFPNLIKGAKKVPIYYEKLYIINGVGGRGYVFAPYLASILTKHLLFEEEIPKSLNPDRLFIKWVRRLKR
jgi:tRNA 5-methylaminomethyl-2-thiouridine biosynthesis bifunctional protein